MQIQSNPRGEVRKWEEQKNRKNPSRLSKEIRKVKAADLMRVAVQDGLLLELELGRELTIALDAHRAIVVGIQLANDEVVDRGRDLQRKKAFLRECRDLISKYSFSLKTRSNQHGPCICGLGPFAGRETLVLQVLNCSRYSLLSPDRLSR